MNCENLADCFFYSCEMKIAITLFGLWFFIVCIVFFIRIFSNNDKSPNEVGEQLVNLSLKRMVIDIIVEFAKKCKNYQEKESKKNNKRNKTEDLLSIANTLIETAKNNKTITFSELCEKALDEEWKGWTWLSYIARRLDIIGHCCAYDENTKQAYNDFNNCFPFINGLTREKYSYKINSGFWGSFWKDLLPIKSYEKQTEENVKEFQKQIYDKIGEMEKGNKIDEFLKKLKTFEPRYEDLKKNNKS